MTVIAMDDGTPTPQPRPVRFWHDPPLRIALIYALFGALWTIGSEQILAWLLPDRANLLLWLTYSGWLFVFLSAILLYWLLRRSAAERASINAQLESNAEQYRLLFESNPNPMWVYDLATLAFLLVNNAAVEKYGYSRAEFLTKTLYDIRTPEDAARLRADVAATNRALNFAGAWRHRKRDGAEFPVEITSHLLTWQGRPARLVVAVDISERKRAQELVQLQAAALEAADNGIVITDADGAIEWVNTAFTRLTGYAAGEAIGRNPRELVRSGCHDTAFYQELWNTILAGNVWRGELVNRRKDGSLYTEEQTITPVRSADGCVVRFVAIKQDVTARKLAGAALQESEERYRSLFASNHSVMLLVDPTDGAIIDANAAAQAYYGWSHAELCAMQVSQINTLSAADIRAEMSKAEQQQRNHFYFQHRRADGAVRDVEVYSGPIPHKGRTLLYSIVHDITERRQNERELRAIATISAALRTALRKADIAAVILDELMALFQVEGASLALLPPGCDSLIMELGRGIWADATGIAIPAGAGLNGLLRATGQAYLNNDIAHEPRIFRPDLVGDCRAVAGAPLLIDGEFTGALWIGSRRPLGARDVQLLVAITDLAAGAIRRTALREQTLQQAEQITRVINSVPEGMLLLAPDHSISLANPMAAIYLEQIGVVAEGNVLTHLGGVATGELLDPRSMSRWRQVVAGRTTFELIAEPAEMGGAESGAVVVIRDITATLSVQQQLQRHERLSAVGQLAAGIAHDFNNIMSVIILYAQMLEQSPALTGREQERLHVIQQQSLRATSMIRQILDFSRRSVLEQQQLDLLPLLKEQVKLLERTLPENIEIQFVSTSAPYLAQGEAHYVVKADPTRIEQMVTNLALNARDAMPNGGVLRIELAHVEVAAGAEPLAGLAQGAWIRLTVADTGAGIEAETLEHIFEPFYTTKAAGKGTGLGLAQVYGIVGQHGGQIAVESQPGVGSSFIVYLPAMPLVTDSTATIHAAPAAVVGQGELVAVIEDNPALRESLVEVLEGWGYRTHAFSNGEEALPFLLDNSAQFALILSDVVMPRLGGIGLFKTLYSVGAQIPMLFITGHPLHDEMEGLQKMGRCAALTKPITLEQLAQVLAAILATSHPSAD
jgi:two-component system cell cycle sensor histidine kinase/response regulator CckA